MKIIVVIALFAEVLRKNHSSSGLHEMLEVSGCQDTEFRLTCASMDAKIAITEAVFFAEPGGICGGEVDLLNKKLWRLYKENDSENFYAKLRSSSRPYLLDFRHAVNRRCSGVNYCSFILKEDHAPAVTWGSGTVRLRYFCVDDADIIKSCVADLDAYSEGFVQSPGYPRFYIGETTCHWSLRARPSQMVKINFLDISLRGVVAPLERDCLDWVEVTEDGFEKILICGDQTGNLEVQSLGSSLEVSLKATSKFIFPKRGILFYYKAVGCFIPKIPKDGFLMSRNETHALFRCCQGFVFPDTGSRDKILHCNDHHFQYYTVPNCVRRTVKTNVDLETNNYLKINFRTENVIMKQNNEIKDIVVPSVIMVLLFVGNAFILLVILRYRKKIDFYDFQKSAVKPTDRELKSFRSSLD